MEYLSLFLYFSKDFILFTIFFSHFEVLWNIKVNFYTFQRILLLFTIICLVILKSYGILKYISKLFKGFLYTLNIIFLYYYV